MSLCQSVSSDLGLVGMGSISTGSQCANETMSLHFLLENQNRAGIQLQEAVWTEQDRLDSHHTSESRGQMDYRFSQMEKSRAWTTAKEPEVMRKHENADFRNTESQISKETTMAHTQPSLGPVVYLQGPE
jgi:hypothetical protein